MDFRSLIDKLEKIDQQQLLNESTNAADQILSEDLQVLKEAYIALMERLNYKVMAQAAKISDEIERKQFLGNQARKNGYPGLFDPVTGKFVDQNGEYAWFGAYKSEVEQMERDGLIPEKARTEALLGLMGKDYNTAYGNSKKIADKDQAIDDANEIMAKGKQSYQPLDLGVTKVQEAKKGTLAKSITESFGYTFKQLVESITREEHKKLKSIIAQLQSQKDDVEVAKLLASYDEYVKIRGVIISKIEAIFAELQKLRAKPLKESREMLREEIYLFGDEDTKQVCALSLYYDSNDNLVEYSARDLASDVSDVGRGAGQALTFGYSDNAVAGIKSLFKGTRYADELKKELEATQKAKDRSPYLYGAGYAIGMAPYFVTGVPGLVAGTAGAISDFSGIRDTHNVNTLMNREKELAAQGPAGKKDSGSSQKPATKVQANPEVKKIQDMILKKDPNALPKYGADGKLGPETMAAAKRLGIALPSDVTPAVPARANAADPAVSQELMTKLGAKDPASAKAAFEKLVTQHGGNVADAIGSLITPTATPVKESITFSSLSEQERMAYLLSKMKLAEGIEALGRPIVRMLELAAGKGTEAVMAALVKAIPEIASKGVVIAGETWRPIAGVAGKFSNGKGAVMEAEQILHVITNTSTVGDTVLFAGKTYQKTASGWTEAGKAKVLPKAEQKGIEAEWAKVNGKDPHAPAPKPAEAPGAKPGETPAAKPGETPAASSSASAAASETIPQGKIAQWVSNRYPRLMKVIQAGKVPAKWLYNNKWWAALAALVAWGYIWPGVTDDTTDPNVVTPGPGPKPDSDQKVDTGEEERKRQEAAYQSQLDSLIKMLQDMFPDDKETEDIIAKVKGSSGSDQKVDDATSKLSKPGWNPNWQGSVGGSYKI